MRGSTKGLPALALAVAVALLGTSVAWAVGQRDHAMWRGTSTWMMGYVPGGDPAPVSSPAEAKGKAQAFAARLDLKAGEVLQFERNFYVVLTEGDGTPATEVLVDRKTGAVSLEYGAAMMWNTRYGMTRGRSMRSMHGMMGRYGDSMMRGGGSMMSGGGSMMSGGGSMMSGRSPAGHMAGPGMMGATSRRSGPATTLSLADARTRAERWVADNQPAAQVETGGDAFPGYFTFETLREGKISGMISVNASSGTVLPHWWHGAFVAAG